MKKLSFAMITGLLLTSAVMASEGEVNKANCDKMMKMDKASMTAADQKMMKKCEKMMKM